MMKDIKKKKLAKKRELAKAKKFLMNKKINIKFLLSQVGVDYQKIRKKILMLIKSLLRNQTVEEATKKKMTILQKKLNEVFN